MQVDFDDASLHQPDASGHNESTSISSASAAAETKRSNENLNVMRTRRASSEADLSTLVGLSAADNDEHSVTAAIPITDLRRTRSASLLLAIENEHTDKVRIFVKNYHFQSVLFGVESVRYGLESVLIKVEMVYMTP
jgi:hypothetical protein